MIRHGIQLSLVSVFVLVVSVAEMSASDSIEHFRSLGGIVATNEQGRITSLRFKNIERPLTDDDLKLLRDHTSLEELQLRGTFTDDGVKHIAGLTHLKRLTLSSKAITDQAVTHLAGLKDLVELELYGGAITAAWGEPIAGKLLNIESLTFRSSTEEHVTGLLPKTKGDAFKYVLAFPKLKHFNPHLHHVYYFNSEAIEYFGQVPHLQTLKMGGSVIGDRKTVDFTPLLKCKALRTFVQFHSGVYHDPTAKLLAQLPEIEHISIEGITDEAVREFLEIPKLRELRMSEECVITPDGWKLLQKMPKLEQLWIGAVIGHEHLETVKTLKNIKSLRISSFWFSDQDLADLEKSLPKARISVNRISREEARARWEGVGKRLGSRHAPQLKPVYEAWRKYNQTYGNPVN